VIRDRLSGVVTGTRPAGVYRWRSRAHPASVARELAAVGWGWYVLDGRSITGPAPLFDRCAEVLAFPAWFGRTFDALAHCLGDLSWLPGLGHVLLWEAWGMLAQQDPRTWRLAYQAFAGAAADRPATAPPLYLLLRGDGPADVPVL
jgi:Barstar (barnase inhibitor)